MNQVEDVGKRKRGRKAWMCLVFKGCWSHFPAQCPDFPVATESVWALLSHHSFLRPQLLEGRCHTSSELARHRKPPIILLLDRGLFSKAFHWYAFYSISFLFSSLNGSRLMLSFSDRSHPFSSWIFYHLLIRSRRFSLLRTSSPHHDSFRGELASLSTYCVLFRR